MSIYKTLNLIRQVNNKDLLWIWKEKLGKKREQNADPTPDPGDGKKLLSIREKRELLDQKVVFF